MKERVITTHAFLPYSPEQVWKVLSDFRAYSEWNPLNIAADGDAISGRDVPMKFVDPGHPGKVLQQTVRVTLADKPHRLEWIGRIPVLFRGKHFFAIAACPGGTELLHGELLSGLIPALWSERRMNLQRRAYEDMNRALEQRLAVTFGKANE